MKIRSAPRALRPAALAVSTLLLSTLTLGCEPIADEGALDEVPAHTDAGPDAHVDDPAAERPTAEAATEAPIGESSHAIHAQPTYVGCTAAQRDALDDAWIYARSRVGSLDYRQCLADAFGVEAEGRMVEELVADTNTHRSIEFRCVPGDDGANAGFDAHGEHMNIVGDLTVSQTTAGLAAIIVHEVAHNHGWWHNQFYGPTWPDQVQGCIFRGQPFGARRSHMAGPTLLTPAGGDGGTERSLRCNSDELAVGIVSAVADNGRLVRLQPLCQDVEGSVRQGNPYTWGMNLPAGAVRIEDRCPAGYGLIGINGSAGAYVERVQAVCGHLGHLYDADGGVAISNRPSRGRWVGSSFSRGCAGRSVATGMAVREGALVDGFQLECDDFPLDRRSIGWNRGGHGGWGGSPSLLRCPGTMALTGIYGQRDQGHAGLANVGGRCKPMTDQGIALGDGWGWSIAFTEFAGRTEETEADNIKLRTVCPDGEVLVGLRLAANHIVADVAALCADPDTWMAGDDTTSQPTPISVRPQRGETVQNVMCPLGRVGTALSVRTGWLVDRVALICNDPDPVGSLRHLPAVGGNGGTGYEEVCPEARPMVGLRTEVDGGLTALTGRCGRNTDRGTSHSGIIELPTIAGDETADRIDDCPAGEVMIGLDVAYGNRLAEWVRPVCGDEDTLRAAQAPVENRLTWRGRTDAWHTIDELRCPAGEVVRGLHGRRGALQDNVGIVCGEVMLLPGSDGRGAAGFNRTEIHPLMIPAGFDGRLRIRLSGYQYLHPRIRISRGLAPEHGVVHAQVNGLNGFAMFDVDDLSPGRWFIEVSVHSGLGGSYTLSVDPI